MNKTIAPLLLTGLLLTACSGGSVDNPTPDAVLPLPPPGAANTDVPSVDVPTETPSTSASASAAGSVSPAPAAVLTLEPDGLSAAGAALRFGKDDQQTVRTALTEALSGAVMSQQVQCAQGERSQLVVDGFQTLFDPSGTFVGWTETGSAEREVTTEAGIGLRSTRDDIGRAFTTVTFDGDTFQVSDNGLSGTLDNLQQVKTLSAGETCPSR